jgi:hypothetical protein
MFPGQQAGDSIAALTLVVKECERDRLTSPAGLKQRGKGCIGYECVFLIWGANLYNQP